jgi:hypothetical protein
MAAKLKFPEPESGWHTISVLAVDSAGKRSAIRTYSFGVGIGGLTSPKANDQSVSAITLASESGYFDSVTYKWSSDGGQGFWYDVPLSFVTLPGSNTPLKSWPRATQVGQKYVFPLAVWDVLGSMRAAINGSSYAGPLSVKACFSMSFCSEPVKFFLNNTAFSATASTAAIGPGTVSLNTGDFMVQENDADEGGLSIGRTATTLSPAGLDTSTWDGIFGAGWTASLPGPGAGAGDLKLQDHLAQKYVTLIDSAKGTVSYVTSDSSVTTSSAFIGAGDANDGSVVQCAVLSGSTCTSWKLTDVDGTVTTWKRVPGSQDLAVDKIVEPGQQSTTTYVRDSGGKVTRIIAPVAAGVT